MCKSLAKSICYYLIILTGHNSEHTLQQLQLAASKFYVRFDEALFTQHRVIFYIFYILNINVLFSFVLALVTPVLHQSMKALNKIELQEQTF